MFVRAQIQRSCRLWITCARTKSKTSSGGGSQKNGLILGVHDGEFRLTGAAQTFDGSNGGQSQEVLRGTGVPLSEVQDFAQIGKDYNAVAVAGVGIEGAGYERWDHCKENIKTSSGLAARSLQEGIRAIFFEPFPGMEAAAEDATMATRRNEDMKKTENQEISSDLELIQLSDGDGWIMGLTRGNSQNIVKHFDNIPAILMSAAGSPPCAETKITKMETAKVTLCGREEQLEKYELKNDEMSVEIITYGATISSIKVPKGDKTDDIALGFDKMEDYMKRNDQYLGCTVGRVVNRIKFATMKIDGKVYEVTQNIAPHATHGGIQGFDKKNWKAEISNGALSMSYLSKDGEEGFPGDLDVLVEFKLDEKNELQIKYCAKTTKPTPVNLTNHSYFNLAGQEKGAKGLFEHDVLINADSFTCTDDENIPTGEIVPVKGSTMDFTKERNLGEAIKETQGYDKNFCVNGEGFRFAACVSHKKTGRAIQVFTDQPGLQFYTGDNLKGTKGKGKAVYKKYGGFCLETQNFPNAVNIDAFPNSILCPSDVYEHTCTYKFILC